MKLGTLLLRDAVIGLGQLEAALRAQVLYGGRLGTNLVELEFLDLDTLSVYLGRSIGAPVATKALFEAAPPDVIAAFDRDLAELYLAFPLGPDASHPEALAVALADPSDIASVEQLSAQLARPVAPYVAPELRLYYYLEKHFGIARKARYLRSGTRQSLDDEAAERRRTRAPGGIEMPKAVRFVPRRRTTANPEPAPPLPAPEELPVLPQTRVTLDEALAVLAAADARDHIGDAFVEYAVGRFGALAVFILRDANAIGWRMYSLKGGGVQGTLEAHSLALGGASVLQAAHDSRQPYRGSAPAAGRQVERKLWDMLGAAMPPAEMVVVPVLVKQRVVNLVYAHAADSGPLPTAHVDGLIALGRAAADAYVRLIQKAKSGD